MPADFFEFKEFKIHQDKCAMKVGTDGVLLGAWVMPGNEGRILDIGTGTGLLALMMAQRTDATIDAVEIDADASKQAADNFKSSAWAEQLNPIENNIIAFAESTQHTYDYIISNPPFFLQGMRSEANARAIARHNDRLTLEQLFQSAVKILKPRGIVGLVLPFEMRHNLIRCLTESKLWIQREAFVRPLPGESYVRILVELSLQMPEKYAVEDIIIEDGKRHSYSPSFIKYTKNFYL